MYLRRQDTYLGVISMSLPNEPIGHAPHKSVMSKNRLPIGGIVIPSVCNSKKNDIKTLQRKIVIFTHAKNKKNTRLCVIFEHIAVLIFLFILQG